jgi:hypothetical protein
MLLLLVVMFIVVGIASLVRVLLMRLGNQGSAGISRGEEKI